MGEVVSPSGVPPPGTTELDRPQDRLKENAENQQIAHHLQSDDDPGRLRDRHDVAEAHRGEHRIAPPRRVAEWGESGSNHGIRPSPIGVLPFLRTVVRFG